MAPAKPALFARERCVNIGEIVVNAHKIAAVMTYELKVFGRFRLLAPGGEEVELASKKGQALIAMLALASDESVTRERLIGVLWADRGENQARSSLRQALTGIRKALSANGGDELLRADDGEVRLDSALYASDAARLHALGQAGDVASLSEALKLLDADLLEGLGLRDAAVEDWLTAERDRLRALKAEMLKRLAELHRQGGNSAEAIAAARRLVALDLLNEEAQRLLMRFLADKGDRAAALQQYKACAEALKDELGIEPDAATQKLMEEIRGTEKPPQPVATPPSTKLAAKLAIAVLPFAAVSGEAREERFADALSRELITELGRFSPLEVAGALSSFAFKGRSVGPTEVKQELGVRFLTEGTVEFGGAKVRVTAQLTDAETSRQIWAQRYDVDIGEGFHSRDQIVAGIAGNLFRPLMEHALRETLYRPPANETSAELYTRLFHMSNYPSAATQAAARELCFKLIAADPGHALVYESLAWTYLHDAMNAWSDLGESVRLAREAAGRGIAIDHNEPYVRCAMGHVDALQGRRQHAMEEFRAALVISPVDGIIAALVGGGFAWIGEHAEALKFLEAAHRQSPDYNLIPYAEGFAHYAAGRPHEAAHAFERFLTTNPDYDLIEAHLAVCHVELGDLAAARQAIERLASRNPRLTRTHIASLYSNFDAGFVRRVLAGLKAARLPEGEAPSP